MELEKSRVSSQVRVLKAQTRNPTRKTRLRVNSTRNSTRKTRLFEFTYSKLDSQNSTFSSFFK
jgi:hypothetical protein